jgi:hypothetical protein
MGLIFLGVLMKRLIIGSLLCLSSVSAFASVDFVVTMKMAELKDCAYQINTSDLARQDHTGTVGLRVVQYGDSGYALSSDKYPNNLFSGCPELEFIDVVASPWMRFKKDEITEQLFEVFSRGEIRTMSFHQNQGKFYEGGYGALTVQVHPNIEVLNSRSDEISRKRSF